MCRLTLATVTLIALHALSKDFATAKASADVKARPVPTQSLAMSAPNSTALGTSLLRRVQTCNSETSNYDHTLTALGHTDCDTAPSRGQDIFNRGP
jgi:hypothetical protein